MLLILFGFLAGCEKEDLVIKFVNINEEGIARFELQNNTEKDIASFITELTYLSEDGQVLLKDTVDYGNAWAMKNDKFETNAFVKAGEKTFFVQKVPDGTISASGKVLNHDFLK